MYLLLNRTGKRLVGFVLSHFLKKLSGSVMHEYEYRMFSIVWAALLLGAIPVFEKSLKLC